MSTKVYDQSRLIGIIEQAYWHGVFQYIEGDAILRLYDELAAMGERESIHEYAAGNMDLGQEAFFMIAEWAVGANKLWIHTNVYFCIIV
jgi:hypothetical protein